MGRKGRSARVGGYRPLPDLWWVSCPQCRKPFRLLGPPVLKLCVRCCTVLVWDSIVKPKDNKATTPATNKQQQPKGKAAPKRPKPLSSNRPLNRKELWEAAQQKRLAYMDSDAWRDLRKKKFAQVGCACEKCGDSSGILQVHHLTYERLYHEPLSDLQVLCDACHAAVHRKKPHPRPKAKAKPKPKPKKKNRDRLQQAQDDGAKQTIYALDAAVSRIAREG